MSNRKDRRNIGTVTDEAKATHYVEPPGATAGRTSIVMPERLFIALLRDEVERLSNPDNADDLRRFFAHFFDPMIGETERETYVSDFQNKPPTIYLGYPRADTSRFPCASVVLESEKESDAALDHFIGRFQPEEKQDLAEEFLGAMFDQTYGIYIYAEHPDVCLYNYHLAKFILLGAHEVLEGCGIIDPEFSGGELAPDEGFLPENMFVRVLRVSLKTLQTVPSVLRPHPHRLRITGIWVHDIVVSGVRGGVNGT